jgi:hypothetical protein
MKIKIPKAVIAGQFAMHVDRGNDLSIDAQGL